MLTSLLLTFGAQLKCNCSFYKTKFLFKISSSEIIGELQHLSCTIIKLHRCTLSNCTIIKLSPPPKLSHLQVITSEIIPAFLCNTYCSTKLYFTPPTWNSAL